MTTPAAPDPHDLPTFFTDHCVVGQTFRRALRRSKLRVEALGDHLQTDSDDDGWIPLVSNPPFEWVIVTKDAAVLSNPHELAALRDSRARVVMFPGGEDLTADEMAARFLAHLPAVARVIASRPGPFIVLLHHAATEVIVPT